MVLAIGLLGSLIGSFLNVVVYRVPRGRSVVAPPSSCPACGSRIRWYDNLPVLSWLLLRGRCRDCAAPIAIRYPAVELATAIAFGVTAWRFVPSITTARSPEEAGAAALVLGAFLYLSSISVALALIDLDTHRLPDKIVLPAYVVGAVTLTAAAVIGGDGPSLLRAVIGAVSLFGLYLALALIRPGGMGFGDVKLAGVLGLFLGWLGWSELIVGAFAAFVIGGGVAVVLVLVRRVGYRGGIPFGPWMVVGAWVAILAAGPVKDGYLSLVGLR
ncbi:prepilin peptidase [Leifsonia sp. WHRI 6310E]|uniref:prepilin peptidase n=1 Tax=Leifsonia sp. WHRI 6310E TaxID=3162562 RepID=UPI0032ED855C